MEILTCCGRRAAATGTIVQPESMLKNIMTENPRVKLTVQTYGAHSAKSGLVRLDPLQIPTL